jgi:hypothetical protein
MRQFHIPPSPHITRTPDPTAVEYKSHLPLCFLAPFLRHAPILSTLLLPIDTTTTGARTTAAAAEGEE